MDLKEFDNIIKENKSSNVKVSLETYTSEDKEILKLSLQSDMSSIAADIIKTRKKYKESLHDNVGYVSCSDDEKEIAATICRSFNLKAKLDRLINHAKRIRDIYNSYFGDEVEKNNGGE